MRYPFGHSGPVVLAALLLWVGPTTVQGQTIVVPQLEARKHLESSPAPTYPMIAMAAKVTGAVNVEVTVAPDGRVAMAVAPGGPPMLTGAAEAGVRGWRFRPFTLTTGEPATARTVITVLYGPQPARAALEALVAYGDAAMLCTVAVDDGQREAALPLCAKAHELEAGLEALRQGPRAALAYSLTLSGAGRHDEASSVLSRTEGAYARAGWTAADEGIGHVVRARAARDRGQLRNAAERYEDAYNRFTLARQRATRDSPMREASLAHMQRTGAEWADVLDQLNRQRDAERVRARVKALR